MGRAAERSSGGRVEMGDGDPNTAFIPQVSVASAVFSVFPPPLALYGFILYCIGQIRSVCCQSNQMTFVREYLLVRNPHPLLPASTCCRTSCLLYLSKMNADILLCVYCRFDFRTNHVIGLI